MRVAMVCPYALSLPGGVQHQATQLAGRLEAMGHEVMLVAPGPDGPDDAVLVGSTTLLSANGSKVPISLDLRARRHVAHAVRDADVVHIHEPLMPAVSLGALLGETPPKVGTFHADPPRWVRGVYGFGGPLLRRWVARLDVVTAVSAVAADAVATIAHPRIVPNGLDVASYDVATSRARHRAVFLGRDEPRKGLDVLLSAWETIRAAIPDAALTVVGSHRTQAPPGVTFLGRVSESDKRAALAGASVYVAPHRSGESFGIVLAEAMAAGCAVVASDLPAFTAVAGEAARYVAPGDAPALAAALVELLDDEHEIESLAAAGKRRVGAFDLTTVAEAYVTAYRDAVAASVDG